MEYGYPEYRQDDSFLDLCWEVYELELELEEDLKQTSLAEFHG